MTGNLNADNRAFLPTWLAAVFLVSEQAVEPRLLGVAFSLQLAPPLSLQLAPPLPCQPRMPSQRLLCPLTSNVSKSLGELCHELAVQL